MNFRDVFNLNYIYIIAMIKENKVLKYDVLIIGAGPAGCACALELRNAGLKVALVDKASFPRDKVCGDAIPGRAIKTLKQIDPGFEIAFKNFHKKYETKKTTLYYKKKAITFNWVRTAYTCTRMEFDNFLLGLVRENTSTDIYTNTLPYNFIKTDDGFSVIIKNSATIFNTKILIGADGAQSAIAKQLTNKKLDRDHHVGSVRAYFSNVSGIEDTTEIYFDREFLPSYLWVFPLPGNIVNVGFGMLSGEIAKRRINIKKAFYDFIDNTPELKLKFKNAKQLSDLEGFGLPLGSKVNRLSGANFMLTGDAASLIDPISGDGIGNAMLSGKLAAEQTVSCFKQADFTAVFMKKYDQSLLQIIGEELNTHYRAQRILSKMPLLLDILFLACKNQTLNKIVRKKL